MLSYRLPERLCYTIEEAVQASGVSRRSIYRAMDSRALPFSLIAGRRRIMCSDLVEWLRSGRCVADSVAPAA
jgi:excisionase family DNA binding protein